MTIEEQFLQLISSKPNSREIQFIAEELEKRSNFTLDNELIKLRGVWELRWSSSKAPFLRYSPFFDNLQILDPMNYCGMNLLRPSGINSLVGTAILVNLNVISKKRIGVNFTHTGLLGPKILNRKRNALIKIKKIQKGWLDITYLDDDIRICRGDKGTLFVLRKIYNKKLFKSFSSFFREYKKN